MGAFILSGSMTSTYKFAESIHKELMIWCTGRCVDAAAAELHITRPGERDPLLRRQGGGSPAALQVHRHGAPAPRLPALRRRLPARPRHLPGAPLPGFRILREAVPFVIELNTCGISLQASPWCPQGSGVSGLSLFYDDVAKEGVAVTGLVPKISYVAICWDDLHQAWTCPDKFFMT